MSEPFGVRLRAQMERRGPLCVGIDPSPALLSAWGLDDSPAGLERFTHTVAEAVGDLAAAVKPQSAFYERWGSRGVAVLERVIPALREAGALVILDAKRGDVDATMAAYAEAYLEQGSPMAVDALTVSPYLGFGSLTGAIAVARGNDAGLFVLARTSNPEATDLQSAVTDQILDGVAAVNEGAADLGPVGVVVGATLDKVGHPLDRLGGPILSPGLGAQGASPADVARLFAGVRRAVLPSVSRAVLGDPGRVRPLVERYRDECAERLRG